MNKCIFLDRDGVINEENGDYITRVEDLKMVDGSVEAIKKLKAMGYLMIVITNQGGITEGLYSRNQMNNLHETIQKSCGYLIDAFYYSPCRSRFSASLVHKPGTLLFERAISRFNIDVNESWMVGDSERDMVAGKKMGLKTILVSAKEDSYGEDYKVGNLLKAAELVLGFSAHNIDKDKVKGKR